MEATNDTPFRNLIVSGATGSGKSTIASMVADRMGLPFLEADTFHSASNVAKMRSGIPLTDADRLPWLRMIRTAMDIEAGRGGPVVVACSALRRRYRDVLRDGIGAGWTLQLVADASILRTRVASRPGHFMPSSLVDSQLRTLEPLEGDEPGVMVHVAGTVDDVFDMVELALDSWRQP